MEVLKSWGMIAAMLVVTLSPIMWTVRRVLRPVDQAAKERNLPMRFSLGDFLCLFWIVQLPLAFAFQLQGEETEVFYWTATALIWAIAPLVWFTCARALSKAGISAGRHRIIFLAVVVPTVYYGLFPLVALSCAGVEIIGTSGPSALAEHRLSTLLWLVLAISLVACGLYSPWMVRQASNTSTDDLR